MNESERDNLHEVLSMSLYDIMNNLCIQMDEKGLTEEWIGFRALNGIDKKYYELKVCLKKIEGENNGE